MHYYQFNIGDYKSHTEHLEPMEDLAFRRMMDWCYLHEKPLPLDIKEIERLIRMRTHSDSIAYVLQTYFDRTADGYANSRIMHEIDKYQEKSDKAKKSAQARWNKKASKQADLPDANALRPECEGNAKHKTLNTKQEPLNNITPTKQVLWSEYDLELAKWFFSLIKNLNPNAKEPILEKWADEFRKMHKIDNRSYNEITDLISWANSDPFWQSNILSPSKLRAKFDDLTIKMNHGNKQVNRAEQRTQGNLQAARSFLND